MGQPRAVELHDLPECEPNTSQARVLAARATVLLVYEAKGASWPDDDLYAVVRFDGCRKYLGGGPNDEAFHNHRFAQQFQLYCLQELVGSPSIEEVARISHKDGNPGSSWAETRHFCAALKEETFECIARGYSLVGTFEKEADAMSAAFAALRTH